MWTLRQLAAACACLAVPLAAQRHAPPAPTALVPLGSFTPLGGKVTGVDIAADGKRIVSLGEYDDAVIWHVDGQELARATIPGCSTSRYAAMHPSQAKAVVVVDRFGASGDEFAVTYLAAQPGAPIVQHLPKAPGIVLGLAWSTDGSTFALGSVHGSRSTVAIYTPTRHGLASHETLQVPSVVAVVKAADPGHASLRPFVGLWRSHHDELAGHHSLLREVAQPPGLAGVFAARPGVVLALDRAVAEPDDPNTLDGLLVADANARLARHIGGLGLGVDEIGQAFIGRNNATVVHAFNAGPVMALVFTPDGRFVAAASRAAVTVARTDGTAPRVLHGKHLLSAGETGDQLLLLRKNLRHYHAETGALVEGRALPGGSRLGEGDANLATSPQLRSFAPLGADHLAVGGYNSFGHDALLVDLTSQTAHAGAGSHRESNGLRIDVRQIERLTAQRYVTREYVRSISGEMQRKSVLRGFNGRAQRWEWISAAYLYAIAPSPDASCVLAADEDANLVRIDAEDGSQQISVRLPRRLHWLAFMGERVLAHDGIDLVWLDRESLAEQHRRPLPAGAPITATALSRDGTRLALGRANCVFTYTITEPR